MRPRAKLICSEVCEKAGMPWAWVIGPRRWADIVKARRAIIWRLVTELKMGPSEIARALEHHHSTVIHHMQTMNLATKGDPTWPASTP